ERDLLSAALGARVALRDRRRLPLVLESRLELVAGEVLRQRAAVEVPLEVLVLDQAESAGREVVVELVDELDVLAGLGRRPDRIALGVRRELRGRDPRRAEDAVVARAPVLPAQVRAAEERRRL